jgi:hypothetical protein
MTVWALFIHRQHATLCDSAFGATPGVSAIIFYLASGKSFSHAGKSAPGTQEPFEKPDCPNLLPTFAGISLRRIERDIFNAGKSGSKGVIL